MPKIEMEFDNETVEVWEKITGGKLIKAEIDENENITLTSVNCVPSKITVCVNGNAKVKVS